MHCDGIKQNRKFHFEHFKNEKLYLYLFFFRQLLFLNNEESPLQNVE
jgi:hypothetical protein